MDVRLPFQGGVKLQLKPTLQLVIEMEEMEGGLFAVAQKLLREELPLSSIVRLLMVVYHAAGADMTPDALGDFILNALDEAPAAVLSRVLVRILTPLSEMGGLQEEAAPGKRQARPI